MPAPPPPEVSLPQIRLPVESVVIFPDPVNPVQFKFVIWKPPETSMPPVKVEVAVEDVALRYGREREE